MMNTITKKFAFMALILLLSYLQSCDTKKSSAENTSSDNMNAENQVILHRNDADKKIDVRIDGELFTSYLYPETIKKPVLYPLTTSKGTKITRGFPLEPMPSERVDHPHHVGIWFNYGDVNGLDFWNNSDSIDIEKHEHYGTIVHSEIVRLENNDDSAVLGVVMNWNTPNGETLLTEQTTFVFRANGDERTIDRITKLTSLDKQVEFKDNKEGMIAIRVTRALEHPSEEAEIFTDAKGIATTVKAINNDGVNGLYYNSRGDEGGDCWGKRAEWVNLTSNIDGEDISLVIMDHPSNVGYPTYWHARTYGLFAANPLGQKVFSEGKEVLDFKLAPKTSATWKHRILLVSGSKLDQEILNAKFKAFSNQ